MDCRDWFVCSDGDQTLYINPDWVVGILESGGACSGLVKLFLAAPIPGVTRPLDTIFVADDVAATILDRFRPKKAA